MKKTLLFLTTILFYSTLSFTQVPANDFLVNATLINSFPFTDSDVRLDLATASGINSPDGCPVGNYATVYYKFTAAVASQFEILIEDTNSGNVGQSYAIIFTAPSLNIADETELSIASACGFSSSSYIDLVQGTNYYILIHRSEANALSNIIFNETIPQPVPTSERDALIAIYNSTNGDQWNNNTNWNSAEPVANWYGISTINIGNVGHVSTINLGSNNLTGTLATEIGDFPELTYLGLWSNQITGNIPPEIGGLNNLVELDISPNTFSGSIPTEIGNLVNLEILWLNQNGLTGIIPASFQNLVNLRQLYLIGAVGSTDTDWLDSSYSGDFPDLTALPLELLRIENNFFQFEDIADEFATYQANIPTFVFDPQYTVDPPEEVTSDVGEDITLTLTDVPGTNRHSRKSLTGNSYQWFKDDVQINGANASSYTIVNAQNSDSGVYSCEITNVDVPGFVISRSGITVNVGTLSVYGMSLENTAIYPNPASDFITIEIPDFMQSKITLYDLSGRLILTKEIESKTSRVYLNKLQSGLYLLKLENESFSITKYILKK